MQILKRSGTCFATPRQFEMVKIYIQLNSFIPNLFQSVSKNDVADNLHFL